MPFEARFLNLSLVIVLAATILPRRAVAQALHVGGRMRSSFTTVGGEGAEGLESHRAGLVVSGLVTWRIHDRVAVQSEVGWVRKGARGTLRGFEEPIAVDLKLDYIELPLLVWVSIPNSTRFTPALSAGGAASFETR